MPHKKYFLALTIALSVWLMPAAHAEQEQADVGARPLAGELVLPDGYKNEAEAKQCLMVCERWGEDCIINSRTGGRNCRKVCKSLAEQCF